MRKRCIARLRAGSSARGGAGYHKVAVGVCGTLLVLLATSLLNSAEPVRLTPKNFAPHHDNYAKGDRHRANCAYIQMRMWRSPKLSQYATADFTVKDAGFYEVWFDRGSGHATAEVMLDGWMMKYGKRDVSSKSRGPYRHFTTWLQAGKHTLRLKAAQNYALFKSVEFRPTEKPQVADALLVATDRQDMALRAGDTVKFRVYGCPGAEAVFEIRRTGAYVDRSLVHSRKLAFGRDSQPPFCVTVEYKCEEEGVFEVLAAKRDGWSTFEKIAFCVVDATPLAKTTYADEPRLALRLVDEIDCADPKDPHFYRGDGQCRIVEGASGKYRESGPGSHEEESSDLEEWPERHSTAHKGYFGYRYGVSRVGQAHIIEVDFPDDARRKFLIHCGASLARSTR